MNKLYINSMANKKNKKSKVKSPKKKLMTFNIVSHGKILTSWQDGTPADYFKK